MTKVVLAHGCFDVLHLGHIRHLEAARALGDELVVSVTADEFVNKGPGRPQFSAEQRVEQLMALKCVDSVIISLEPTAISAINLIKPHVYVKGPDYIDVQDHVLDAEIAALHAVGGHFKTTATEKWASTDLLKSLRLTPEAQAYVEQAKSRHFRGAILRGLEEVDRHEVNFLGEHIWDVYNYVKPLAKPPKEHILATMWTTTENFAGGVTAASKHCEWKKRRIITVPIGITKARYVDKDYNRKLFEVYSSVNSHITNEQRVAFQVELLRASGFFVVTDFGHGLIHGNEIDILAQKSRVAATVQTNAGNFGFNQATKYKGIARYICVDQPEARLATGMRDDPIEHVCDELAIRTAAEAVTITSGPHGAVACDFTDDPPTKIPSLAQGGKDTMGAGDAFLAVAGPLVLAGVSVEIASFAGNIAGALKINIVGHRSHVTREDFVKHLDWLLA